MIFFFPQLVIVALWESVCIAVSQWCFMSVFRDGNGRSGAADLFWRAACWWWLNVFLCCVSTSFTLLLSVLQRLHPAKTLHGQCQVISENTFRCFKNLWRTAAKDSRPRVFVECGTQNVFKYEERTPIRVKEYTCSGKNNSSEQTMPHKDVFSDWELTR